MEFTTLKSSLRQAREDKRLRVLFYLYFAGGGIGRYTTKLMPEISELGIDVEAVVLPEFQWKDSKDYACWPHLRSISHQLSVVRKINFLVGQIANPRRLFLRAEETKPDIIHICNINHLSFPFWEHMIAKSKARIVASVHDVKRTKGILCKSWESWQLKRFYRRADWLFVHSEQQREELFRFAGVPQSKISIVPHGPYDYPESCRTKSEIRSQLEIPASASLGLAFGLIRDEKNLDRLLRAWKSLPNDNHLLIAGNQVSGHRPIQAYKNLARKLGIIDRMHFITKYIPDEQVSELFVAADWVALAYSTKFTSQSGVLNSAVHYRKPTLLSPAPTFSEGAKSHDIGVVCEGDSILDIETGIEQILSRIASKHTFEFEQYIQENSWNVNAELTVGVYDQLTK